MPETEKLKYEPGESIGSVCAQSLSEPATQMTLWSIHLPGFIGAKITHGLPRLIELIDIKKGPRFPYMRIPLKLKDEKEIEKLSQELPERYLKDLVKDYKVDLIKGKVIFNLKESKEMDKVEKVLKRLNAKKKGNRFEVSIKRMELKSVKKLVEKLLNQKVGGIKGIKRVQLVKEGPQYVIITEGSHLKEVMKLKGIDTTQVMTNCLQEIAETLGIEAARKALVEELHTILAQQGIEVSWKHLCLLADLLTWSGKLMPIGRYGIVRRNPSTLVKAGFEETLKQLRQAVLKAETDELKGPFENIMIGNIAPTGTGSFWLLARFDETT